MSMFMKLRVLVGLLSASCLPLSASAQVTSADVTRIINQAVTRAVAISPNSVIAVTDREGDVLAVWVVRGGAASNPEIATAVSKAGSAAFLSSNQNAFTSRTAGFIIQQHFPPGVKNAAPGPLVGVAEHLVSLSGFLELGGGILVVGIGIGMILHRQLAIRDGNVALGSVSLQAEDFVVVAFGSHCCHGRRKSKVRGRIAKSTARGTVQRRVRNIRLKVRRSLFCWQQISPKY